MRARRHGTSPTAAAALGRSLMGAVLIAAEAKDEETVQLQFRGDGPLRSLTVIADAAGRVRGFAGDPAAHPPPRHGKLDVAGALAADADGVIPANLVLLNHPIVGIFSVDGSFTGGLGVFFDHQSANSDFACIAAEGFAGCPKFHLLSRGVIGEINQACGRVGPPASGAEFFLVLHSDDGKIVDKNIFGENAERIFRLAPAAILTLRGLAASAATLTALTTATTRLAASET